MNEYHKPNNLCPSYPLAVFLAIVIVFVIYTTLGLFWEDYEKGMASFIYGNLYNFPYDLWFMEGLLFLFPSLALLSENFAWIPVYGIFHIIILILSLSLWFQLSFKILYRMGISTGWQNILLSTLFICSVVGVSLVYVNVSRSCFILCSVSLLLYLDKYLTEGKRSFVYFFLFLFGSLLRIQAAILTLGLVTLIALLIKRDLVKILSLFKYNWGFVLICVLLIHESKSSTNTGQQMENTYEYAIMDRKDVVPISQMKNKRDSIRYEALTGYFIISDSAQITVDFIKRVVDMKRYLHPGINREDLSHCSEVLLPLLQNYHLLLLLFYFGLLIIASQSGGKTIINIVLVNIAGWLIACFISMKINVIDSFLGPWIVLLFSGSIFIVFQDNRKLQWWQSSLFISLLFLSLPTVLGQWIAISRKETDYNLHAVQYIKRLDTLSAQYVPVIWDYSQSYLITEILSRQQSAVLKKCIQQSPYAEAMYYKFGQERTVKMFGCSSLNWPGIYYAFKKNPKVKFVIEPELVDFLRVYYKNIYNVDFILVRDEPLNEIFPNTFVYHLDTGFR